MGPDAADDVVAECARQAKKYDRRHDLESQQHRERLAAKFEEWTTSMVVETPSKWAERKRYLPPSVTAMPGPYRFDVAPYIREIVDCLSVDSPVRRVTWMKGVQICATVGVLENAIGYCIDHVKTAPVMLVTADSELAKLRMESYITPMIQNSGLDHLIKSTDEKNTRKTGKTDRKIEWEGGGFLVPFGAKNANKLRSVSIQILLLDEIDGWPDTVGKDGDPLKLVTDRTAAYETNRKIAEVSTPNIKGQSKIETAFLLGDQRRYFVNCLNCGHSQTLRWRRVNQETGEISGIVWDTDNGRLVPGSVRYLCEECLHPHTNDDKTRLLSQDNGAEWRPTAVPKNPFHRSYHLSALYSPVGMQSWEACVMKWLEAWDDATGKPRDLAQLQVFYNNVLGETYELRGEKLRFEKVSEHRRKDYRFGEVPNAFATQHCGGPVVMLTCAVDVHADNLAVAVFGWCRGRRSVLIDYWRFEGDTSQLDNPDTWGRLAELIDAKEYVADDGKRYRITLTLIDSGYLADQVYRFAAEYAAGVYPIKGRDSHAANVTERHFAEFTTPMGRTAYTVTVDLYKDRISAALRRGWDRLSLQPPDCFNAPIDIDDKQLKELTVEVKREKIEKGTGRRVGFEWYRPAGVPNELWDLYIYNTAALELTAWDLCRRVFEMESVSWATFFDYAENEGAYYDVN